MIDTTTINYAVGKISEGWAKVAPGITNIGEKYVQYVVTERIVLACLAIFCFGLWALAFNLFFKKAWDAESEPKIGCVLGFGIPFVAVCIFLIASLYNASMAIACPEMYTVQSVINAAKGR